MQRLLPTSSLLLAKAVADGIVVAVDDAARHASQVFWEWSRPWVGPVVAAAVAVEDDDVRGAAQALLEDNRSRTRHERLRQTLVACAGKRPGVLDELFDLAWLAETNIRLGYHVGDDYPAASPPVTWQELEAGSVEVAQSNKAPVLIVIPFRDDGEDGSRVRNMLACLTALRDQSFDRESYRVTVVESDTSPRWEEPIRQLCEHYVFAPKGDSFNKAWAVNVGVFNTPGAVELVCVLDADILTDRDFVSRNVQRFLASGGVGAVIPYRDALSLGAESSATAIHDRVFAASAAARPSRLRGFTLRRPPGGCVWARASAFRRVGGMDERYEGWGGEDNDFLYRMEFDTPLDRYDDPLVHLHHSPTPPSPANAGIPPLSWKPNGLAGDVNRFGSS